MIIRKEILRLDYKFFEKGNYNLNIIGIRNNVLEGFNEYSDELHLIYKIKDKWINKQWDITTLAGKHYMENPMNMNGTAILVPGQYLGAYQLGLHRGRYKALIQKKALLVYRDNNKDDVYDLNSVAIKEGFFGINIHKGNNKDEVDKYSAGCQVFKFEKDFNEFMAIVDISRRLYGNKFTYTLIDNNPQIVNN